MVFSKRTPTASFMKMNEEKKQHFRLLNSCSEKHKKNSLHIGNIAFLENVAHTVADCVFVSNCVRWFVKCVEIQTHKLSHLIHNSRLTSHSHLWRLNIPTIYKKESFTICVFFFHFVSIRCVSFQNLVEVDLSKGTLWLDHDTDTICPFSLPSLWKSTTECT